MIAIVLKVRQPYNGYNVSTNTEYLEDCLLGGCKKPVRAMGYCGQHYHIKVFLPKHPLYNVWQNMKRRCYDPRSPKFYRYGARGVRVCPRWRKSYRAFEHDIALMGLRPSIRHTLDRINNNGDYAPGNVQWATPTQQAFNRGVRSTNKSGVTGVFFNKRTGKWLATLTINKHRQHLGWFTNKDDAVAARVLAEARVGYTPIGIEK